MGKDPKLWNSGARIIEIYRVVGTNSSSVGKSCMGAAGRPGLESWHPQIASKEGWVKKKTLFKKMCRLDPSVWIKVALVHFTGAIVVGCS